MVEDTSTCSEARGSLQHFVARMRRKRNGRKGSSHLVCQCPRRLRVVHETIHGRFMNGGAHYIASTGVEQMEIVHPKDTEDVGHVVGTLAEVLSL